MNEARYAEICSSLLNNKEGWRKVKKICLLTEEEVRMAKALGLTPKKVFKMIPSKAEPWKDSVPLRLRRWYSEKFGPAI